MTDTSGRSTFPERKAGVGPGSQLRPNVTDLPEAELKKLGVKKPITITDRGVGLILKMMQETGKNVRGSITDLTSRFDAFRKGNLERSKDLDRYIKDAFPDGIEGVYKSLDEFKAYEQFLYDNGFLQDADPELKRLDEEFKNLPKSGQNRRSREGKRLLDIKERGGVPVIVGRDGDGKPIEDPNRTRPYRLALSKKGLEQAKKAYLPIYAQTKITPQIEMQDRQRQAAARREARPAIPETPTIQERTAKLISPVNEEDKLQPRLLPSDEPKPMSERTKSILGIIKKGGRKGLKALPFVAAADILTSPDPVAALTGSTPVADATLRGARAREEAARVRERAGPDYERMRSADEETFSRIAEEEASGRLKGPRGFLYLD